jgi:glycosyltransferase involved in cell wall biosynthesis
MPNNNKRIKMLFISSDKYPPFRVDVAVLFGKELCNRGHQIDYLLQSEANCSVFKVENWMGSRAFVGPTNNGASILHRFFKHILNFLNDLRMFKLIASERYNVVQVKDKFLSAIVAMFLAKLKKTTFTFWLSYPFPEADIYSYQTGIARYPSLYLVRGIIIRFLLYKIILPRSDYIFVQSDQMKKDVASYNINEDKIFPVPMGIDLDDARDALPIQQVADKDVCPKIVYIGEIEKIRKIDIMLKVFKKVLDSAPNSKLFMIGGSSNPQDLEMLKNESKLLNIDHSTVFTGLLPRKQALDFVKKATICVSPIYPNPIYLPSSPTKIIEYMLMSKPVVANKIPDQHKIISESQGGFCVDFNIDEFAEAIIKLINNPEKAIEMGKKGHAYVKKNRSYKIIAENVEYEYLQLIR